MKKLLRQLTLRSRIFLYLLVFALIPLLVAALINLPLVLDRVELFYRHAFLQDLRADFRDLDQHLASRDEMVRLLAKLPEPGVLVAKEQQRGDEQIDLARARYIDWVNRVLANQLDIVDILFFDQKGVNRFWLQRNVTTASWEATPELPARPPEPIINDLLAGSSRPVEFTPVRVDSEAKEPARILTLQLLSPIRNENDSLPVGLVAITVDIGGLVHSNPDTLWVNNNGGYLNMAGIPYNNDSAFDDFPGLEQKFSKGKIMLWQGDDGRQVIWVPMLQVEGGLPLWVGRDVDLGPLNQLQQTLIVRVSSIIFVLALVVGLLAKWVADRAERFGQELIKGIRRMLERDQEVTFSWRGAQELVQLGDDLSALAKSHAENVKRLREHAKELELSNQYKSEFLSNVSHELRTPLNSIILLSKMLASETEQLGDEQKKHATVINQASTDLRELIDAILDLSKMDAGQTNMHIESVQLHPLMSMLQDLMSPQFEQAGLDFELRIAPNAPQQIETDETKLRQILKNFLGNAVKFTEQGKVSFILEKAPEPYFVRLSVKDTGIGIKKEKQQLIFEAFKQEDGSTSRRYGGTGLGLAISRNLAELLQGSIELVSTSGEGSCFSLLLPEFIDGECEGCTPISNRPMWSPEPENATEIADPIDLTQHNVLLIEANVKRLLELTGWLESSGANVTAAADEDELIETLDEAVNFNLILFTSVVPGIDQSTRIEKLMEQVGKSITILDVSGQPELECDALQKMLIERGVI